MSHPYWRYDPKICPYRGLCDAYHCSGNPEDCCRAHDFSDVDACPCCGSEPRPDVRCLDCGYLCTPGQFCPDCQAKFERYLLFCTECGARSAEINTHWIANGRNPPPGYRFSVDDPVKGVMHEDEDDTEKREGIFTIVEPRIIVNIKAVMPPKMAEMRKAMQELGLKLLGA